MKLPEFLREPRSKGLAIVCLLTLAGGLVAAGAGLSTSRISLKLADPNEGPSRLTMAPAAHAAMPSVVKISSSKVVKQAAEFSGPQRMDPRFRQFFGRPGRCQQRHHSGCASGGQWQHNYASFGPAYGLSDGTALYGSFSGSNPVQPPGWGGPRLHPIPRSRSEDLSVELLGRTSGHDQHDGSTRIRGKPRLQPSFPD